MSSCCCWFPLLKQKPRPKMNGQPKARPKMNHFYMNIKMKNKVGHLQGSKEALFWGLKKMKENYLSITQFVLDNLKNDKINIKALLFLN
jgi:hypothetical protein